MQDQVAEPLEKRPQELTWYDRVETTTRPGYAYMTVTLKDSTPPSSVQVSTARSLGMKPRKLPSGVLGPFVNDEYSDVSFALYALKAKGMPMRELARQAETIRQDLLHVPGVKKINILGERPEQIFIEFSYAKLATLGVSAQDIVAALQRQNTVTPAGSIDTKEPQVFIRVDGAYDSVQAIADTPIVAAGRTLKLSDIAEVRRGYEDPPPTSSDTRVSPPSCSRRLCKGAGMASRSARRWRRGPQLSHGTLPLGSFGQGQRPGRQHHLGG